MTPGSARPVSRRVLAIRSTAPDGTPLVATEVLAHEAGLHPDLVRRLITVGAIEPSGGTARAPLFPHDAAARLARIARLRRDLGLNLAGALLACDLLARIEAMEDRLARYEPRTRR
jgi:DNA-binding transcriptional MerR regulator